MEQKRKTFIDLCNEVRNCTTCQNIMFTPHVKKSDCLIKDEPISDSPYVNRWNLIQDSLDADIMVIGQDYGVYDEKYFATDLSLKKLFQDVFNIDIEQKNSRLFFTNIANCYRKHKSVGAINKGCLALCANKYMARLIRIISPKVIIVLGQETFNALACCDRAALICKNPTDGITDNNFKTVISFDYRLMFEDGQEIAVFPVYHPGSNGRMNRKPDEQIKDWKRIADYLE